ncbi:MAG: patatin-like phospholipase family protein [Candidatus Acetothermia bacterium]|nr:patatin-like phospholipase family protein [Candidatus Acetothermia bacterium]MDH7505190.1 patatin-like phospholipase family protein [Candidatus Acetothermia bacterium]
MARPVVGLALSSGGPRGAAHAGVLRVLEEHGIPIDIIVGTSMGAMVGGAYAAGVPIARVEEEWLKTDLLRVAKSFLPTFPLRGWSSGSNILKMLQALLGDVRIEALPIKFAAVATDIDTGNEVVLQEGPLVEAIRASSSIPGLFVPVEHEGRLLVDGGLVNPLPVDVARRLGAEIVIAVDLGYYPQRNARPGLSKRARKFLEGHFGGLIPLGGLAPRRRLTQKEQEVLRRSAPSVVSILILASVVLQRRIVELNLRLFPPDVLIRPKLADNPPRYHQAARGIAAGAAAAEEALDQIKRLLSSPERR